MKIALVVVTDGRQPYMAQCLDHLRANVPYFFNEHPSHQQMRIIVNDSDDLEYEKWLRTVAPEFTMEHHRVRRGLAQSVQSGWGAALRTNAKFVFHVEEDFLIYPGVNLHAMAEVLRQVPYLASLTLKRNAWSPEEQAAGGQIPLTEQVTGQEMSAQRMILPAEDTTDPMQQQVARWIEHQHLFSLNPSLIPRRVVEMGWPSGPLGVGNESGMTAKLLDDNYKFAYWGGRDDPPLCEHIGYIRSQSWML